MPWADRAAILLLGALIVVSFPLLIIAFYRLRLGVRRRALRAKLIELSLESEYIKVFDYEQWERIEKGEARSESEENAAIRKSFDHLFNNQFRGDNSPKNYIAPVVLTLATTIVFALYLGWVWTAESSRRDFISHPILFAIAGAMLYVYPQFVARYASLSLNPPAIFDLIGRLWLSVLIGVVAAVAGSALLKDAAQPLMAFGFSLLPLLGLDALKKKLFAADSATDPQEVAAHKSLLAMLGYDRDLLAQFNYIGVRSIPELAYENPLRLFVEADPNLIVCIDLVDQANLHLYVPDPAVRKELGALGIRTSIDLMTQLYDEFPDPSDPKKPPTLRFLDSHEPLPPDLRIALAAIARAMGIESVEALRNTLAMMRGNPQLQYVFYLWATMSERVDAAFEAGLAASPPPRTQAAPDRQSPEPPSQPPPEPPPERPREPPPAEPPA